MDITCKISLTKKELDMVTNRDIYPGTFTLVIGRYPKIVTIYLH